MKLPIIQKERKEPWAKRKREPPFLKTAYSDTGIPQIPASSRSLCSSKISKFSKSIKLACAKLAQNIKPTGFFLLEFIPKVCRNAQFQPGLKWDSISDLGRRDLKKCTPADRGGKRAGIHFIFKPLTYCKIQANRGSEKHASIQSLGMWLGLLAVKKKKRHETDTPSLSSPSFARIPPQRQPKPVLSNPSCSLQLKLQGTPTILQTQNAEIKILAKPKIMMRSMAGLKTVWGPKKRILKSNQRSQQLKSFSRPEPPWKLLIHSAPSLNISFNSMVTDLGSISPAQHRSICNLLGGVKSE